MPTTALSISDFFGEILDEIKHIWTDDVLPYFAKFGIWGVSITKNIMHDLQGIVADGVNLLASLTGAALKQIWAKVIEQVNIAVRSTPDASFADKIVAIRDAVFSTVNWGSIEAIAIQIAYTTITSMITGFLSMAMSGTL